MVLESVLKSRFVLKHPLAMLFFGIVVTTISIGISLSLFPEYASLLSIAFITIGSMPVLFRVFAREEKTEARNPQNPATFLERHFHIIQVFAFLFIGILVAFTVWAVLLPSDMQAQAFKEQEKNWNRIQAISGQATSRGIAETCQNAKQKNDFLELAFSCIFANNAIVLTWGLVLAFFYGAGAIFLVSWNASVIGLVLGKEIQENGIVSGLTRSIGLIPHGIFEIGGYLVGAIAGGIISAAIVKHKYVKQEFETIAKDVLIMAIIAYALILIGALVEAMVILSP